MVNISKKNDSYREAHAQAKVILPSTIINRMKENIINNNKNNNKNIHSSSSSIEFQSKKGPVFNTAIVAGIMAVKKACYYYYYYF